MVDLASSNLTMGLALYLMHSSREALVFVQRSDSMFCEVALLNPDPPAEQFLSAVLKENSSPEHVTKSVQKRAFVISIGILHSGSDVETKSLIGRSSPGWLHAD